MIDEMIDLQRQLEDSNARIGNNQQARQQYDEAMTKIKEAREAINRLAVVFDKEHGFSI
jgi:hypothetical protein